MTGNEMKIEVVNPWVGDLTQENLDTNGITEAYGRGLRPEIMFKALDSNSAPIYIAENTGDTADKLYLWRPSLPADISGRTEQKL